METGIATPNSRSWLFTPATRPERFPKAIAAGADLQIVDLEDSVAPRDKARARDAALRFLRDPPPGMTYARRLNSIDTAIGLADWLAFLESDAAPTYLIVPKVDSAGQLHILDKLLVAARKSSRLVAQLESAAGLTQAETIATTSDRLAGLMFGTADMAADLGTDHSWAALQASSTMRTKHGAVEGTPLHSRGGEIPTPSSVYQYRFWASNSLRRKRRSE